MAKVSAKPELTKALFGLRVVALHDKKARQREQYSAAEQGGDMIQASHEELGLLMDEALRCIRISKVIYDMRNKNIAKDVAAQMICSHVGLDLSKVSVPHALAKASWLLPAHYVLHDTERRELVIAVRGTLSVQDVLADLGAEEVDLFVGGKAHKSMLLGACNVLRAVAPVIQSLADDVDTVTLTGHSLGGGVASYLALLISELVEGRPVCNSVIESDYRPATGYNGRPEDGIRPLSVRCMTFGSPGVCSLEVSRSHQLGFLSFCHADDVVPRVSLGHVLELHCRAIAAAEGAGEGVQNLLEAARQSRASGSFIQAFPEGLEAVLEAIRKGGGEGPSKEPSQESLAEADKWKLYPMGRCFLVQSDGGTKELTAEALAPRIELGAGRSLVIDHLPRVYEAVMLEAVHRLFQKGNQSDLQQRSRL
eukprot:TRINITY_DN6229_c0_g2_i1.p1 TRINITY_DN6229_c0_g2~~TRINITY_DN6229_c0_g2_i1.p1  ORF type:complete len:456 (+),score=86.59 TRINITY_DN6229_c0_g2_i1:101-1369(+)